MKNRKIYRLFMSVLLLITTITISACGSSTVVNTPEDSFYERSEREDDLLGNNYQNNADEIYQKAMERFMEPGAGGDMEGRDIFDKVNRQFLSGYHRTYRVFRSISPVVIVCSVAIGILMMVLARQNKKVRRTGLVVFIIGLPAAVIVAVFGIGVLNGVLLY